MIHRGVVGKSYAVPPTEEKPTATHGHACVAVCVCGEYAPTDSVWEHPDFAQLVLFIGGVESVNNVAPSSGKYKLPSPKSEKAIASVDDREIYKRWDELSRKIKREKAWFNFWLWTLPVSVVVVGLVWWRIRDMGEYDATYFSTYEWSKVYFFLTASVIGLLASSFGIFCFLIAGDASGARRELEQVKMKDYGIRQNRQASLNQHVANVRQHVASMCSKGGADVVFLDIDSCVIAACSEFVAVIDAKYSSMYFLRATDCLEVKLETRESSRATSTYISGNRSSAVGGAVLGGLLFGDDGMDTGAIVGAAGPREGHTSTVVNYVSDVVLFTTMKDAPCVTFRLGENVDLSCRLYGMLLRTVSGRSG